MRLNELLEQVAAGKVSTADALLLIEKRAVTDLGFARVDLDRYQRCRVPEVIYSPGKTPQQILEVMQALAKAGQPVLATRATAEQYVAVKKHLPQAVYHELARAITLPLNTTEKPVGFIGVAGAGTTDLPVAEEAVLTAQWMGARVERFYDLGVAGLHRLLGQIELLRQARVLIVVAGMEGALPSVLAGLLSVPIIAVPTSVGYGSNLQGLAALLAMLNSCVPGITVVNIDNGFGAGVAAALINARFDS